MSNLEETSLNRIEAFNHELDRSAQGYTVQQDGFTPEDQQAFLIASRLSRLDFSEGSAIRFTLRNQFATNARHDRARASDRFWASWVRDGRMMAGICFSLILLFGSVFALLAPWFMRPGQQDLTLAANQVFPGKPAFSYTLVLQQPKDVFPKPMPTPIPISASQQSKTVQPISTPNDLRVAQDNFPLFITLTLSK